MVWNVRWDSRHRTCRYKIRRQAASQSKDDRLSKDCNIYYKYYIYHKRPLNFLSHTFDSNEFPFLFFIQEKNQVVCQSPRDQVVYIILETSEAILALGALGGAVGKAPVTTRVGIRWREFESRLRQKFSRSVFWHRPDFEWCYIRCILK